MNYIEKQAINKFKAGDIIFREDDPGNSMFIIQTGIVEVSKTINKQKVVLAKLKKGSIFGEMALVDSKPRSATVTAITGATCLEMSRMLFNKRLEEIPKWMRSFYQILVDRLRETDNKQSSLEAGEVAKQIVYFLSFLLSREKPDRFDSVSIPWKKSTEHTAFLLNIPIELVTKVMNKVTLTELAKSEIRYKEGRQFVVEDFEKFRKFSEYCKEFYFSRRGREISPEFKKRSVEEIQMYKLVKKMLSEQSTATDLSVEFFENRCIEEYGKTPEHFKREINDMKIKGILTRKIDSTGNKYYDVDREVFDTKLSEIDTLDLFEMIERELE